MYNKREISSRNWNGASTLHLMRVRKKETNMLHIQLVFFALCILTTICTVYIFWRPAMFFGSRNRITLFTTLHDFPLERLPCSKAHIQELAILSWVEFASEIVILVDDATDCPGLRQLSSKIVCKAHHCSSIGFKRPTMSCLFMTGEQYASNDILMYTNPDFVYTGVQDTVDAVRRQTCGPFLIVGCRVTIDADSLCQKFNFRSYADVMRKGEELGQVEPEHSGWAMDYFIYPKYSLPVASFPPFLVGVWRWDNWLFGEAVRQGSSLVIDATASIIATHLGYTSTELQQRTGAQYNTDLWKAALPGGRPIPEPAGLGDMQFSSFFTSRHANGVDIIWNETAAILIEEHRAAIVAAQTPPPPSPPPPPPLPPGEKPPPGKIGEDCSYRNCVENAWCNIAFDPSAWNYLTQDRRCYESCGTSGKNKGYFCE